LGRLHYFQHGDYDNALKEGLKSLEMDNALNSDNSIVKNKASLLLSEIFEKKNDLNSAYKYL
jgi:hypothetical protein